jgi:hypothetical protein
MALGKASDQLRAAVAIRVLQDDAGKKICCAVPFCMLYTG